MRARLERDIEGRAPRGLAGTLQRLNLGMGAAAGLGPTAGNDDRPCPVVARNHRTDRGVGPGAAQPAPSERERKLHETGIIGRGHCNHVGPSIRSRRLWRVLISPRCPLRLHNAKTLARAFLFKSLHFALSQPLLRRLDHFGLASGFTTRRTWSRNNFTRGLSIRFFRVTTPTGIRVSGSEIGNAVIARCL